jgi:hypothetical protein
MRVLVWTRNKTWWWRFGILLWLVYIYINHAIDYSYPMNRIANIFNAIDFGVHEVGHIIFIPLGQFMAILGGSLLQIIFPIVWMVALITKKWYFAAVMCLIWLSYNLYDVAAYVADARARMLPLATLSTDYDSAHDWYQILSRIDKLESDTSIALLLRMLGSISAITGIILGLILLSFMLFKPFRKKPEDLEKPPLEGNGKAADPKNIYPEAPPTLTSKDFK